MGTSGRVVVVGGGIAGLAAAHRLRELAPELEVTVLERATRPGGKIQTEPLSGVDLETGAETFLMREFGGESAVFRLAGRLGLGDQLVHPASVPAALAIDGRLERIPANTLMGIPVGEQPVAKVMDNDRDEGRPLLAAGEDIAVGALIRPRLGDEVVDRLVDPLLGGVYAGRADRLSLAATIPGLHRAASLESTVDKAVRRALADAPRPAGTPIFASVHGGLSRLVRALADTVTVKLGQTVRSLERTGKTWRISAGETFEADGVILAVPAAPANKLLADKVIDLEYASVALVSLVYPQGTQLPELSGFLVPATEGYAVKAATFFTRKWSGLAADGRVLLRASLGRIGDEATLQQTDDGLIKTVRRELPRLMDQELPDPLSARVNRWGGGLPQYGVGHVDRVAELRHDLPERLALAGAAFDGVGIAACVRSGETAAESILQHMGE